MQFFGDEAVLKDRPNSHRLIELTVNTIPQFGHGKLISELILELTHTFFKKWLKENTRHDSHITAVDLFLCRNWSLNLYFLHKMWKYGDENDKSTARKGLVRLFFGSLKNADKFKDE